MDLTGFKTFSRGSGSVTPIIVNTLQETYDVSTSPQIVTDSKALIIKSGIPTTQNILQIKDFNNVIVCSISNIGFLSCVSSETLQSRIINGLNIGQLSNQYTLPIDNQTAINGHTLIYNNATEKLQFGFIPKPAYLDTVLVTQGIGYNNEVVVLNLNSPITNLQPGNVISVFLTGAVSIPAQSGNILKLSLFICNTVVNWVINLPTGLVTLKQFRCHVDLTIRTLGVNGTSYAVGKFEYEFDNGTYINIREQIGFFGLDTTSTSENLRFSVIWPTFGSDLFVRGGTLDIK